MCCQLINRHRNVSLLIGGVLGALGLACYFGCDALVKWQIKKALILTPDSYSYDIWKDIPFAIEYKIYIFNLTNPYAFEHQGAEPVLEEVGPYVFSEHRHKENITFNSNGTVSYQQRRIYHWVYDKMNNVGENDKIVTVNLVLVMAYKLIKNNLEMIPEKLRPVFKQIMNNIPVVSNQTVGALFFTGWNDPLIEYARSVAPNFTIPQFALMANRNDTTFDGFYNVFTGASDINKLGMMDKWRLKNNIGYYRPDSTCDAFNYSSAGEFRPPFVIKDKSDPIYIFSSDMCRSFRMDFHEQSQVNSIKTKRYVSDQHEFDYELNENKCFCQTDNTCPLKGVSNISACYFDAPVFVSFPHFLHGSNQLVQAFKGLNPDEQKHKFYMDYEPTLGLPLAGSARAQLSLLVERDSNVTALAKLKHDKTYWPLAWLSINAQMPDDMVFKLKLIVTVIPVLIIVVSVLLLVLGILLLLVVIYFRNQENLKDSSKVI